MLVVRPELPPPPNVSIALAIPENTLGTVILCIPCITSCSVPDTFLMFTSVPVRNP